MTMEILNLAQGSQQWHQHRATVLNASDAPAMLGVSPYKTRSDLVRERATGISPEVTPAQQRIFDQGHAIEALARPLAEAIIGDDLSPCVGKNGKYGASFDGLTFDGTTAWECKSLNSALREALPYAGQVHDDSYGARLPEYFRVQLEQQAMVSGCTRTLFTAASMDGNGDIDDCRHCWYTPDPAMRARLVPGWDQFEQDVAAYANTEPAAPVTAAPMESLPAVVVQVQGALSVAGNLPAFGQALREFIARIPQRPESDQQFADAEAACKALKKAEDALAQAEDGALAQISDVELMRRTVSDLKDLARRTRLATEKLVKAEKDARRTEKVMAARAEFDKHVARLQVDIKGVRLIVPAPDFGGAIKGLSSLASIDDKLTAALIAGKADANTIVGRVINNLKTLDSVPQYAHLFADRQELVYKDGETLELLMQKRVDAEAARIEAERQRIRAEEERKAREAAEREAAERVKAEQAAQAEAAKAGAALLQQAKEQAASLVQTAKAIDTEQPDAGKTLTLGQLNTLLSPIAISAAGLAELGFQPVATAKAAKLYDEGDIPAMCRAIAEHVMSVAQVEAA